MLSIGLSISPVAMQAVLNRPLLSLDFTGSTLPDGVTFSRASAATDTQTGGLEGFASGEPRLGPLGMLIEDGRTTSACGKISGEASTFALNVSVTDGLPDPLGGTGGSQMVATSAGTNLKGASTVNYGGLFGSGIATHSAYVKPIGNTRYIQCFGTAGSTWYVNFDLSGAGAVGTTSGVSNARIEALSDGGYIISYILDTNREAYLRFFLMDDAISARAADSSTIQIGDGLFVFAANAVNSYGATSLISGNNSVSVTRSTDRMVLTNPQIINRETGSIEVTARTGLFAPPAGAGAGTDEQALWMILQDDGYYTYIYRAENKRMRARISSTWGIDLGVTVDNDSEVTVKAEWDATGWTITTNGVVTTHTGGTMDPTVPMTRMTIGDQNFWREWNGYIKRVVIDGNWTPAALSPDLWIDTGLSTITDAAGAVSQVNDLSGNDNHLVQATGSLQPTTGVRSINGINTIYFDGSERLDFPSGLLDVPSDEYTLVTVFEPESTAIGRLISGKSGSTTNTGHLIFSTNMNVRIGGDSGSSSMVFSGLTTTPSITTSRFDGTSDGVASRNSEVATTTGGAAVTLDDLHAGWDAAQTSGQGYKGEVAFVLLVRRQLTDVEMNKLVGYLKTRFALAAVPTF